jgi:competence protein ComEC
MVPLAAGFALGTAWAQGLPALPGALGLSLLAALLAAGLRWRCLWLAALAAGCLWAAVFALVRQADGLPAAEGRQQAVVEGVVLGLPKPLGRGARFDFEMARVLEPPGAQVPRRLRLSWYAPQGAALQAGETWRFRVSLRPPRGTANPGGFDYEQWLFEQGLRAVGYVRDAAGNQRLADGSERFWSADVWRRAIRSRLQAALGGSPQAGLVEALALGVDDAITPRQWTVLRRTGTLHLIAVSGSHIGLVAGLAFFAGQWLFARLGVARWPPPSLAAGAGLCAAWLYAALTGFSIPAQRALVMVAVAMGAVILRRNLGSAQVWATALLAVLLWDPMAVLAPGFWLSFGAVALIGYAVFGRAAIPPKASLRPPGGLAASLRAGLLRRVAFWGRGALAMLKVNGYTALGLAPLLLLFFRQVSLVSPVANLLAVPILGIVLIPLCLAGALLSLLLPEAGGWLLRLADWILARFWPVLEGLADWPWAQWTRAEPPFWTFLPAGLGVALLLAPRGIPARWLGLLLLLPALTARVERPLPGEFRLALLDVGQGLAAVVETRHRALVFDTGPSLGPDFDMGSAVVEPYLRQRGIQAIDALVVSHGDNDHSGGARALAELFPPIPAVYASAPERLAGLPARPCRDGQAWNWDGVMFAMLGPVNPEAAKGNDASCVLRVSGRHGSALLTGDIERAAEAQLVARHGAGLRSTVLVVPHHGSKTSSTAEFLAMVRPRDALVPAGYLNRFGFPHPAVLRRYAEVGAEVWTTAASGALEVDGVGVVHGYRAEQRRYWRE